MGNLLAGRFWMVHGLFWLVAGSALFISGLTQTTLWVSLLRNAIFGVGGYVVGIALTHGFRKLSERFQTNGAFLATCLALAFVAGTTLVVLVNPLSAAQLGIPFAELTLSQVIGGTMNYGLVMVLWSLLVLFLFEPRLGRRATGSIERRAVSVEVVDGRVTRRIRSADVLCVRAAGDYVELVTAEKVYIKRSTLNAMERSLPGSSFVRVHRSALVNRDHVAGVESESKGRFELVLANGDRLFSSRGYRERIAREWLGRSC